MPEGSLVDVGLFGRIAIRPFIDGLHGFDYTTTPARHIGLLSLAT
jgi:hypothetical protein